MFKIVLIGDASVGKTALVYRFVINEAPSATTSTVGVEFTKKVITDRETGNKYQLHIWDTAG
jgi:Rab family protein